MAQAEAIQERDETEGLADTAQGDVKGTEVMGGIEEAVQAVVQEGEFFHDALLVIMVLLAQLEGALAGDMLSVAAEGGGAEGELPSQGAVRDPLM